MLCILSGFWLPAISEIPNSTFKPSGKGLDLYLMVLFMYFMQPRDRLMIKNNQVYRCDTRFNRFSLRINTTAEKPIRAQMKGKSVTWLSWRNTHPWKHGFHHLHTLNRADEKPSHGSRSLLSINDTQLKTGSRYSFSPAEGLPSARAA